MGRHPEDRVVAEALIALRCQCDDAPAFALGPKRRRSGRARAISQTKRAPRSPQETPFISDRSLRQLSASVGGGGGPVLGVAGGEDPGGAAQGVHRQAGVVGQGRDAR